MKKLPDKKSELLRLAVNDAKKVSKDKRYVLNMFQWHVPAGGISTVTDNINKTKKCLVCLAGSVMAKTLGCKNTQVADSESFDHDTNDKLEIINNLREGEITYNGHDEDRLEAVDKAENLIGSYYNTAKGHAPWNIYLKAADILAEVGL